MKKIMSLSLAVIMIIMLLPVSIIEVSASNGFAGGDGTKNNPYQISTPEQLDAIRNDLTANYVLINDIDLSNWDNWEPIGNTLVGFKGSLNGNNHIIENMKIEYRSIKDDSFGSVGLFGNVYGNIQSLIVKNANINVSGNLCTYLKVGIIAGNCSSEYYSRISNCNVSGLIKVDCSSGGIGMVWAGGVAGSSQGSIEECSSDVEISIKTNTEFGGMMGNHCDVIEAGGIVGRLMSSKVKNCFSTGNIDAQCTQGASVGGIVGCTASGYGVKTSYSNMNISSKVVGNLFVTGDSIVGGISGIGTRIEDSVFMGNLNSQSSNGYAECYEGAIVGVIAREDSIVNSYSTLNSSKYVGLVDNDNGKTGSYGYIEKGNLNSLSFWNNTLNFDFENVWQMTLDNYLYPTHKKQGYTINNTNLVLNTPNLKLLTKNAIYSNTSFEIQWSEVHNADFYKIEILDNHGNIAYIDNVSYCNTPYKISNLAPNRYKIKVTAGTSNQSSASNVLSIEILKAVPQVCKTHKYTSTGGDICTVCGYKFEPKFVEEEKWMYATKNNIPIRDGYYEKSSKVVYRKNKNNAINVVGYFKNSLGNKWYKLIDGNYVYSGNLTDKEPKKYTITFDANGGTNAPGKSVGYTNFKISTLTIPTRSGYEFLGYSTSKNAAKAQYKPGSFIKNVNKDMTLYAVWVKNNADVNINKYLNYAKTFAGMNRSQCLNAGLPLNKNGGWCAGFLAACATNLEYNHIIPNTASPEDMYNRIIKNGGKSVETPNVGDVVFFHWAGKQFNSKKGFSHVGIVEKIENGKIYVLHGNYNTSKGPGVVCAYGICKYENCKPIWDIKSKEICAYARPNWN